MERKVYLKLTSLEKAQALFLYTFSQSPLSKEKVSLAQAQGRTLAEPAAALLSSPAFHGAAMDGVAVKAEDTYGASERRPKTLAIGREAFWVNTGRPLPPGCNAVIMVEDLVPLPGQQGQEAVAIEKAAFPWQHVRKMGEDMVATEIILPPGVIIGPYELGALAAAGVLAPVVHKKPKVAILPSGSELTALDQSDPALLAKGEKLPEFNSVILSAMVREAGGEPTVYDIVPDDPMEIKTRLTALCQSEADLVVIIAGSSAGSRDYTAQVVSELGQLLVHGISIMPGKPTVLGNIFGKPVLGAPGYPVSAIFSFENFGQTLLAHWQDRAPLEKPEALALPFQALPSKPGMLEFIRVKLGQVENKLIAVPLPRGAGTVTSLSRADGIIAIPADQEGLSAEEPVSVSLIRPRQQVADALLAIGSHDNTLDLLDSLLRRRHPGFSLTSAHLGSLGGLLALKNNRCHLAGSHLLGSGGVYNIEAVQEHLPGMALHMVRLVDREQGLLVLPGNPQNITTLKDLTRKDVTFINRQRGSGTRVLLDWQLSCLQINPEQISGYEEEEYTHMNVAVAVLSGLVSTGLGVRSAAQALGLDFIPIGVEEYDLLIRSSLWDDPRVINLLAVIGSEEFKNIVQGMGGYGLEKTGQVVKVFP